MVRIVNDKIEIRSLTTETAKSRTKYFSMNSESFTVPPVIAETASFHASSLSKLILFTVIPAGRYSLALSVTFSSKIDPIIPSASSTVIVKPAFS